MAHLFVPCLFEMISRSKSWVGLLSRSAEEGGKGAFEKGSVGKVRWLSGKGEPIRRSITTTDVSRARNSR
jgi:hypothetical protein